MYYLFFFWLTRCPTSQVLPFLRQERPDRRTSNSSFLSDQIVDRNKLTSHQTVLVYNKIISDMSTIFYMIAMFKLLFFRLISCSIWEVESHDIKYNFIWCCLFFSYDSFGFRSLGNARESDTNESHDNAEVVNSKNLALHYTVLLIFESPSNNSQVWLIVLQAYQVHDPTSPKKGQDMELFFWCSIFSSTIDQLLCTLQT